MIGMVALMFSSGMARNPMSLLFPVMMMVSMLGMLAGGGRSGGARASEANEDRKDYLRYLDQMRSDVAATTGAQRAALEWSNPEPSLLWTLAGTVRMWERQITDSDYCHVRVGLGTQRLATRLVSPETGPVEDLEPVAAVSLRRFVRAHSVVQDLPTAVSLRGFAAMSIEGQRDSARALVRSMLMQLCTFHGPDTLQVAVVCGPDTESEWEWVKWLHTCNTLGSLRTAPALHAWCSVRISNSKVPSGNRFRCVLDSLATLQPVRAFRISCWSWTVAYSKVTPACCPNPGSTR